MQGQQKISLDQRIANVQAQLEQSQANTYGLRGALQVLLEIQRDELEVGVSPAPAAPQEPVE